jgi:hypothetical protein
MGNGESGGIAVWSKAKSSVHVCIYWPINRPEGGAASVGSPKKRKKEENRISGHNRKAWYERTIITGSILQDQIGLGVRITEITRSLCNSVQIGSTSERSGGAFGNLWSYSHWQERDLFVIRFLDIKQRNSSFYTPCKFSRYIKMIFQLVSKRCRCRPLNNE